MLVAMLLLFNFLKNGKSETENVSFTNSISGVVFFFGALNLNIAIFGALNLNTAIFRPNKVFVENLSQAPS